MKAIIVSKLRFPGGDAGSIRHETLGKMLQAMGYQVVAAGLGDQTGRKIIDAEIPYTSFRYGTDRKKDKIRSHLFYKKNLKEFLDEQQPQLVLSDDLGPVAMIWLRNHCKKRKIILLHDSVEWYSPEQFKHGKWSLTYIKKDLLNRFVIDRNFRVIAISRYLHEHFSGKGIRCVRIPVVIGQDDLCRKKRICADKVVFTYAGQPGKKDYLHVMLQAFSKLPEALLERTEIRIVGCTEDQMIAAGISKQVLQTLHKQLVIYGRVSHEKVLQILESTDFTMLMRSEEQRYAKAGFPTKVVESLSNSTPVICNITSDLGLYLEDQKDSLFVKQCSADALEQVLAHAISLTKDQRLQMDQNAYMTSYTKFESSKYLDALKSIIQ